MITIILVNLNNSHQLMIIVVYIFSSQTSRSLLFVLFHKRLHHSSHDNYEKSIHCYMYLKFYFVTLQCAGIWLKACFATIQSQIQSDYASVFYYKSWANWCLCVEFMEWKLYGILPRMCDVIISASLYETIWATNGIIVLIFLMNTMSCDSGVLKISGLKKNTPPHFKNRRGLARGGTSSSKILPHISIFPTYTSI